VSFEERGGRGGGVFVESGGSVMSGTGGVVLVGSCRNVLAVSGGGVVLGIGGVDSGSVVAVVGVCIVSLGVVVPGGFEFELELKLEVAVDIELPFAFRGSR
jgi:hypothetical protein